MFPQALQYIIFKLEFLFAFFQNSLFKKLLVFDWLFWVFSHMLILEIIFLYVGLSLKQEISGLHKLRAQLQPCTECASKLCYTFTKIHAHYWFLYIKVIWICQFIIFLSLLCLVASSSRSSCCHACYLAALSWLFFFPETDNSVINQLSLCQSKGWWKI